MSKHYDYYEGLCTCPGTPNATAGNGEHTYGFMDDICVCPGGTIQLGMRDLDGNETTSYPVAVYNVNEVFIGYANTKNQYRNVWNSDPDNQAIGTLSNAPGPFSFYLDLNPGQAPPAYVIGDPDEVVDTGIYGEQYASQYE